MSLSPEDRIFARRQVSYAKHKLQGGRALITAVIGQAYSDYLSEDANLRAAAGAYFTGDVYKHHLSILGLPGDWLPELMRIKK